MLINLKGERFQIVDVMLITNIDVNPPKRSKVRH